MRKILFAIVMVVLLTTGGYAKAYIDGVSNSPPDPFWRKKGGFTVEQTGISKVDLIYGKRSAISVESVNVLTVSDLSVTNTLSVTGGFSVETSGLSLTEIVKFSHEAGYHSYVQEGNFSKESAVHHLAQRIAVSNEVVSGTILGRDAKFSIEAADLIYAKRIVFSTESVGSLFAINRLLSPLGYFSYEAADHGIIKDLQFTREAGRHSIIQDVAFSQEVGLHSKVQDFKFSNEVGTHSIIGDIDFSTESGAISDIGLLTGRRVAFTQTASQVSHMGLMDAPTGLIGRISCSNEAVNNIIGLRGDFSVEVASLGTVDLLNSIKFLGNHTYISHETVQLSDANLINSDHTVVKIQHFSNEVGNRILAVETSFSKETVGLSNTTLQNSTKVLSPILGFTFEAGIRSVVSHEVHDLSRSNYNFVTRNVVSNEVVNGSAVFNGTTWPAAAGTENKILKCNPSAQLEWADESGGWADGDNITNLKVLSSEVLHSTISPLRVNYVASDNAMTHEIFSFYGSGAHYVTFEAISLMSGEGLYMSVNFNTISNAGSQSIITNLSSQTRYTTYTGTTFTQENLPVIGADIETVILGKCQIYFNRIGENNRVYLVARQYQDRPTRKYKWFVEVRYRKVKI